MSLRIRLVVAFFALSVVPLAAVTFYSYQTNVNALRVAAEHEADLLAGELSQRMQLVTAQLSERVEHLMDIAQLQADVKQAQEKPAPQPTSPKPVSTVVSTTVAPGTTIAAEVTLNDKVAQSLGEAAMLLNNVEFQGMSGRYGGSGRRFGPPPGSTSGGAAGGRVVIDSGLGTASGARSGGGGANVNAGANATANVPRIPVPGSKSAIPNRDFSSGGRGGRGDRGDRGERGGPPPDRPVPPGSRPTTSPNLTPVPSPSPAPSSRPTPPGVTPPGAASLPAIPMAPGSTTPAAAGPLPTPAADAAEAAKDKLRIDITPIRREMLRQILPDKRMEDLTPDERQRVADEINQRMLGIVQGIQLGAKELQRQAEQAQQARAEAAKATAATKDAAARMAAGTKSKTVLAPVPAPAAPPPPAPAAPAAPNAPAAPDASATATDLRRKSSLTGNRLDVRLERDGKIVQQANAEINLPNVLATVFSTTRNDGSEVPFAVGKDGHIYTRSESDRARVERLGAVAKPDGPASARLDDYIVVTTTDPSGTGMRLGIARPVGDSLSTLRRTAARNAGVGLLFIVVALVGIVPLSKGLTRNLTALSEGVHRIALGDYRARVPVKARDEVGRLAAAFNQMAEDVEKHQRAAVEQERLKRELELGRQIQHDMLPHAPLRLGLTEIKGVSVPAREVGGDFFNYFELTTGQIALLVGDVSGKGVGAALLMANIQASLRTRLALGQGLSDIANQIDAEIDANSPGPVYATLFVGILDPLTRKLRYVNAGHHPQFVLFAAGGLGRMESTGLPVGMLSGHGYREQEMQLSAGDLLFFYTDGCVEADNNAGDMYGAERLETLLMSRLPTSADDVLQSVEADVSKFRGTQEPFDDATMMAVKIG